MKCSACGSRKINAKPELYPGGVEAMGQPATFDRPGNRTLDARIPGQGALYIQRAFSG